MDIKTVGIMSPGDMGHAIGDVLRHNGLKVVTSLKGRSSRTASLAEQAGIINVIDYKSLVRESDILISVLVPSEARKLAEQIAEAIKATHSKLLFAECNAISPHRAKDIAKIIHKTGCDVVDVGIIGAPPGTFEKGPRFYASGQSAPDFLKLSEYGLDIRVLGTEIGQASGLKMCYGALTKGLVAISTEALVAGKLLNIGDSLKQELYESQPQLMTWIESGIPTMPPKAYRWVGEMEEISSTFGNQGLTPKIYEGVAAMFRFITKTSLGREKPEVRVAGTSLDEVIKILSDSLEQHSK